MLAYADTVFKKGKIYTVNPDQPWVEAVAIREGHFVSVGSNGDINALIGPQTVVVDLEGRFAMPGIYDCHTHPTLALRTKYAGELALSASMRTLDELEQAILDYAAQHPGDGWIIGGPWLGWLFEQSEVEPRVWLDTVIPDRPVGLYDTSYHNWIANSKTIEMSGVTKETRTPIAGRIERNTDGELTGVFVDSATSLLQRVMPPVAHETLVSCYREAAHLMHVNGIVSTKDMAVDEQRMKAAKEVDDEGRLNIRLDLCICYRDDLFIIDNRWNLLGGGRYKYHTKHLQSSLKVFLDGVLFGVRSAYMLEPYDDAPDWRGVPYWTNEELRDLFIDMDRRGIRISAHMIGDAAARQFLDAAEQCRRVNGPNGVRHCLVHNVLLHPNDIPRFRELNITAEFSAPYWYSSSLKTMIEPYWGKDRTERIQQVKSVLDTGSLVVAGSDWPITGLNPLVGLETLVTRENPWEQDDGPRPGDTSFEDMMRATGPVEGKYGEPISLEQAIRIYTINGAIGMDLGDKAGSIEVGKHADMIVLDRNLFDVPIKLVHNSKVLATIFDGNPVYMAPSFTEAIGLDHTLLERLVESL